MPMLIGFANYLVPLHDRRPDMAFPRMNALSYWVFLFGGLLLYSSFFFGGALDTGWFSYAPLTERAYSPHDGVTSGSSPSRCWASRRSSGAVNFIVTMLRLRAPGMGLCADADVRQSRPTSTRSSSSSPSPASRRRSPCSTSTATTAPRSSTPATRRRPHHLAAPLLVLRPPRGVHPHPAGLRHHERGRAGLLAQAAVRAQLDDRHARRSSASWASSCGRTTCSPPGCPTCSTRSSPAPAC